MSANKLIDKILEGKRAANVVAGALFDFAGYMTTRDKSIKVGAKENPSPVLDQLKSWSRNRHLNLDDADVEKWTKALERVASGESASDVLDEMTTTVMVPGLPRKMAVVRKDKRTNASKSNGE